MSQSDETWNEVGEGFKNLGSMFKQHYASQEEAEGSEAISDDEVKDAVRTIGESLKTAFATVGDSVKDPEVQEEAKQTAKSFFDALGATFAELGNEISKWRDKDKTEAPTPSTEAAPEEPTEPPAVE